MDSEKGDTGEDRPISPSDQGSHTPYLYNWGGRPYNRRNGREESQRGVSSIQRLPGRMDRYYVIIRIRTDHSYALGSELNRFDSVGSDSCFRFDSILIVHSSPDNLYPKSS